MTKWQKRQAPPSQKVPQYQKFQGILFPSSIPSSVTFSKVPQHYKSQGVFSPSPLDTSSPYRRNSNDTALQHHLCGQASLLHYASCSAKCPRQQPFLVERSRNSISSSILKISSYKSTGMESMIVLLQRLRISFVFLSFLDETVPLQMSNPSTSPAFRAAIGGAPFLIQRGWPRSIVHTSWGISGIK